jgi:hypothetical protein
VAGTQAGLHLLHGLLDRFRVVRRREKEGQP